MKVGRGLSPTPPPNFDRLMLENPLWLSNNFGQRQMFSGKVLPTVNPQWQTESPTIILVIQQTLIPTARDNSRKNL